MSQTPLAQQVASPRHRRSAAPPARAGCGDVHGIPIAKTATDIGQAVCSKRVPLLHR